MSEQHDYTRQKRGWGRDLSYTPLPGNRLDAYGWGSGIRVGDYLLLTNPAHGRDTRYQVESIRYMLDPPDQWFAILAFAPRDALIKR